MYKRKNPKEDDMYHTPVLIDFLGQIIYIVYSNKYNTPVTALPIENYRKRIENFRIKKKGK